MHVKPHRKSDQCSSTRFARLVISVLRILDCTKPCTQRGTEPPSAPLPDTCRSMITLFAFMDTLTRVQTATVPLCHSQHNRWTHYVAGEVGRDRKIFTSSLCHARSAYHAPAAPCCISPVPLAVYKGQFYYQNYTVASVRTLASVRTSQCFC